MLILVGNPYNVFTVIELYPDPDYDPGSIPRGWLLAIIIALLATAVTVSIFTAGTASGTVLASVHTIAVNAAVTGATSAILGAVTGGVSYNEGNVYWDSKGASDGFIWGAISGVIFGAISGGLSGIGGSVPYSKIFAQGAINAATRGGQYLMQSAITGNFSWDNLALSLVSGFVSGGLGALVNSDAKGLIIDVGISIVQTFLEELIKLLDSLSNKANTTKSYKLAGVI